MIKPNATTATAGISRGLRIAATTSFSVFDFFRKWPVIPAIIIAALLIGAIFAPWLEPHLPLKTNVRDMLTPPAWYAEGSSQYLLGTDPVGRDILSRLIHSARITVMVVVVALGAGIVIGSILGLVAGYFGGVVDEVIMRIVDMWSALPYLLVILTIVVVFGQGFMILIAALTLISWPGAVRLVRAEVLRLRTLDYVALAKVAGSSTLRILYRHILPGVINVVVVTATLRTGQLILTEATLSFLGAGVPPPNPSWGAMVADGRQYLREAWWVAFFPGLAILLVVMAGNFLGDWMRDYFDPRLRQT